MRLGMSHFYKEELMKKILCLMAAFVCFLICTLSVRADVIWEPEDSFYEEHASKCSYVNRSFTADGPDGTVILYESPESAKVVDTWGNGYQVYISYTYEGSNGILWGVCENESGQTGWVPMEYMKVVYDHISFQEDYGSEIVEQSGVLEEQYRGEDIWIWEYPGAKEPSNVSLDLPDLPEYISMYRDEKGYNWGYVGYYYARRDFWVCIDQPMADYEQLYPDGGPQIGARAEDAETENHDSKKQETDRIVPEPDHGLAVFATVLVALVVLVTAGLLVILKKRK